MRSDRDMCCPWLLFPWPASHGSKLLGLYFKCFVCVLRSVGAGCGKRSNGSSTLYIFCYIGMTLFVQERAYESSVLVVSCACLIMHRS